MNFREAAYYTIHVNDTPTVMTIPDLDVRDMFAENVCISLNWRYKPTKRNKSKTITLSRCNFYF